MDKPYSAIIESPLGILGIRTTASTITHLDYLDKPTDLLLPKTAIAHDAVEQLQAYFAGKIQRFALPLAPAGTSFQQAVYAKLQTLAFAQTITYGKLAEQQQSGARAVGNACRHNPIPILIPCHRVVGKQHLGGYAGHTRGNVFAKKIFLLEHEQSHLLQS